MLNEFINWLDEEIEELRPLGLRRHGYIPGAYSEAIRIKAKLEEMMPEYREEIDHAKGLICDHFCRFPEMYADKGQKKLEEERCYNCPLNKVSL